MLQIKELLDSFSLLGNVKESPFFMKQLSPHLERTVYFPNDYIIYKVNLKEGCFNRLG